MNNKDIFSDIRDWILFVINDKGDRGVKVIFSNQNAPMIEENHIVINYPAITDVRIGSDSVRMPDENGTSKYTNLRELNVRVEELNGDGDLLKELEETLIHPDVLLFFREKKISISEFIGVESNNEMFDNIWKNRSICDIRIFCVTEREMDTGLIQTVEIEKNYE